MDSIEMMMSHLINRKQYVFLNGNVSDILLTGNVSVAQGSTVSGLYFSIYTLDQHSQTHKIEHSNHKEYNDCKNDTILVYIDDTYGIITEKKRWKHMERHN